tara:strand:- start:748 stop:2916 length:2169 start_codon:yes stop_codon:yes gene_type:complete
MALHSVSPDLLDTWDEWSRGSEKYDSKECRRQWRSFKSSSGITVGTLIHMVREDGHPEFGSKSTEEPTGLESAIMRAQSRHGPCAGRWPYSDADGRILGWVVRYEKDGAKTYRPFTQAAGSWVQKGLAEWPLYRLPEVLGSTGLVFVCEGEKAADALCELGLTATTSQGGSAGWKKSDWSVLEGRTVILLPDNDVPGESYGLAVANHLVSLRPAACVGTVHLPGIPVKGDAVEFIGIRRNANVPDKKIASELDALGRNSLKQGGEVKHSAAPFPLHLLPRSIQDYVRAVAESRCVDVGVVAAAALAAVGSAIGLTRLYRDSLADWTEPPIFWLALVGTSGSRKSPVLEAIFAPCRERQVQLKRAFDAELSDHKAEMAQGRNAGTSKDGPEPPIMRKLYSTDSTTEALAEVLEQNPRGVTLLVDELSGLFGSMGRYSGRADADRSFYLTAFNAGTIQRDRRTSRQIVVERGGVSVVGGIQPAILARLFNKDAVDSGLASRFLLVQVPQKLKQYQAGPTARVKAQYASLINQMYDLEMATAVGSDGQSCVQPVELHPDENALKVVREFVADWSEEIIGEDGRCRSTMIKLEGYALRFALLFRCLREAESACDPTDPISEEDMRAGIEVARWFGDQARAVFESLDHAGSEVAIDRLACFAEVIHTKFDGAVTRREWHKRNNRRSREDSDAELDLLVTAGRAIWRPRAGSSDGGRKTEECHILAAN